MGKVAEYLNNYYLNMSSVNTSCCKIHNDYDYDIHLNGAFAEYKLVSFNVITSICGDCFAKDGNGIRIIQDCEYIKVFATINTDLHGDALQIEIRHNGQPILNYDSGLSDGMISITTPSFLVKAQKNDLFTVTIASDRTRNFLIRGGRSMLQVEIVR